MIADWWNAVLTFFGVLNEAGPGYAFWSGVGSDIGEVALIGGVVAIYRKHNCHVSKCWRIGKHPHAQDGNVYMLCRRHHPTVEPLAAEDIHTRG